MQPDTLASTLTPYLVDHSDSNPTRLHEIHKFSSITLQQKHHADKTLQNSHPHLPIFQQPRTFSDTGRDSVTIIIV